MSDAELKPFTFQTAGFDARFPNQNQVSPLPDRYVERDVCAEHGGSEGEERMRLQHDAIMKERRLSDTHGDRGWWSSEPLEVHAWSRTVFSSTHDARINLKFSFASASSSRDLIAGSPATRSTTRRREDFAESNYSHHRRRLARRSVCRSSRVAQPRLRCLLRVPEG